MILSEVERQLEALNTLARIAIDNENKYSEWNIVEQKKDALEQAISQDCSLQLFWVHYLRSFCITS